MLELEGVGYLLYLLLDEIVDGYLDLADQLEARTDDIQDRVDREDGSGGSSSERLLARDVFHVRRNVATFRRLIVPMREVTNMLQGSTWLVTPTLVPYYRDIQDHVIRTLELLDNIRDILTSAREVQLAIESMRLNVVMKKLTGWAAIIAATVTAWPSRCRMNRPNASARPARAFGSAPNGITIVCASDRLQ